MSFDKRPLVISPRLRGSFWHAAAGLLALTSLPAIGCGPVGDDAEATSQSQLGEAHKSPPPSQTALSLAGWPGPYRQYPRPHSITIYVDSRSTRTIDFVAYG